MSCYEYKAYDLLDDMFGWQWRENPIKNPLEDREISGLAYDLLSLIYTFEKYKEGDWGEYRYLDAKVAFKKKWLETGRKFRAQKVIDEALEECREELYKTYGIEMQELRGE